MERPRVVELIPPRAQALWGWPAVLNFFLGGLGAGVYAVTALAGRLEASPAMSLASWLGPALVLTGFAAVAAEAGRPFRGPLVLLRARTSWMSRELWIGVAFVLFALAEFAAPRPLCRAAAGAAALLLPLAQGFILRRARGIAAWHVSFMPALFVLSALVSGVGLHLVVETATGRGLTIPALAGALVLQAAGLAAWVRYLTWSREAAFLVAVRPLARGLDFRMAVGAGYTTPFLLTALAVGLPGLAPPAVAAAGALMMAGQLHAKVRLILTAGQLRPITLSGLSLQRRPS